MPPRPGQAFRTHTLAWPDVSHVQNTDPNMEQPPWNRYPEPRDGPGENSNETPKAASKDDSQGLSEEIPKVTLEESPEESHEDYQKEDGRKDDGQKEEDQKDRSQSHPVQETPKGSTPTAMDFMSLPQNQPDRSGGFPWPENNNATGAGNTPAVTPQTPAPEASQVSTFGRDVRNGQSDPHITSPIRPPSRGSIRVRRASHSASTPSAGTPRILRESRPGQPFLNDLPTSYRHHNRDPKPGQPFSTDLPTPMTTHSRDPRLMASDYLSPSLSHASQQRNRDPRPGAPFSTDLPTPQNTQGHDPRLAASVSNEAGMPVHHRDPRPGAPWSTDTPGADTNNEKEQNPRRYSDIPEWSGSRQQSADSVATRLTQLSANHPSLLARRESEDLMKLRAHLGLDPAAPVFGQYVKAKHQDLRWSKIRLALREPFLEFWGVFIMVLFGNGSIAQATLSKHESSAPGGDGYGSYFAVTWAWALGVMLGIYVAGDSGAYLNPALTFTNCIFRKVPWRRFPSYLIAQLLGGFVASGVVYANYVSAIDQYEGHGVRTVYGDTATASLFCTYPQSFLPRASQFFSDFIPSSVLAFVIYALKDSTNNGASMGGGNFFPLALFFVVVGIGTSFGWETGYAINPARDFGPRVMSYFLGYGSEVFSAYGYYFWVPIISPFCGCAFGGALYDIFIYTGESPINTEWMGLKRIFCLNVAIRHGREHEQRQKDEGVV